MERVKDRLLSIAYTIVPLLLGIAFSVGDFTYIGVALIVAVSAWYLILGWKAVLSNQWALLVIGFFLAIALKDGTLFALGQGSFKAFAKSGSRVFVLAGTAAFLMAYEKHTIEKAFGTALGIAAAAAAAMTILARLGVIPWIINANMFGETFVWFPLYLAYTTKKKGTRKANVLSLVILLAGFAIVLFEAFGMREQGSRAAPLAFLAGAFFLIISRLEPKLRKWLAYALLAGAVAAIFYCSLTFDERINNLLANRQYLWNAYAHKGIEHIWFGWGWTDSSDNQRIIGEYMKNTPFYQGFVSRGFGPHNSLLAMFFENGILALIAYIGLVVARIARARVPFSFFDISLMAFIVFFSIDAFAPGALSFLGYYLGVCLLAVDNTRIIAKSADRADLSGKVS